MTQINQYLNQATEVTAASVFDVDFWDPVLNEFRSMKIDLQTIVAAIQTNFPNLFDTLYTSDGQLFENRTVDLSNFKLIFQNGSVYIGTTGVTPGIFKLEIVSSTSGILSNAPNGVAGQFNGNVAISAISSYIGVFSYGRRNVIRDDSVNIPPDDQTAILDIISNSRGILIPRLEQGQIDAIPSPSRSLLLFNVSRDVFQTYDPIYGWRQVGPSQFEFEIDFSQTPLDPVGVNEIFKATRLKKNAVMTRVIVLGEGMSIHMGGALRLDIGFRNDDQLFYSEDNFAAMDSPQGTTTSFGNSNRTTDFEVPFRVAVFEKTPGSGEVLNSGKILVTIIVS